MPTTITPVPAGSTCTEFRIKVMIFSPEAGFKFDVTVQRKCFPTKFLLNFNLFKKSGNDFVQIVGVEFEAEKKEEQKAIEDTGANGINPQQSQAFRKKVYPLVKGGATEDKIHAEMSKAIQQKHA
jgi:hypothetical protein